MKNSRLWKTPFSVFLVTLLSVLILPGASRAAMSDYCQIPPYAFQSVLPSVTFLISNSTSMLNFAYGDVANPANLCTNNSAPCGGFDNNNRHYGYFDPDYWYVYTSSGGGRFERQGRTNTGNQWSGNFLNWLTLRRIDVTRKIITGGEGQGYATCLLNNARYKKFPVNSANFTPYNADNVLVTFNQQTNCDGLSLSNFSFDVTTTTTTTTYNFDVKEYSSGTRSGIYQEFASKAQMEFSFFNGDNEGGNIAPQIDGSPPPTSSMMNRINTPSNFNGIASAPLGEALWTIVGHYALSGSSSGAGYGSCTSGSNCGPRYHNVDYNPGKDPYTYHGSASRCVKGNVIVLADGEPCSDGNLPYNILHFADNAATHCTGSACFATPFPLLDSDTTIPSTSCTTGATAGVEHVSLFAHTQDLRNLTTFANQNLPNKQNLDLYVIRAFGSDNSNLLKYAAINGSFDDLNGNGVPDAGEFSLSRAYLQADDGYAIEASLREIMGRLLRRATSGTAASVLASGEGSGANLVQAVFYPRRTFGNEIIEWTGTMQNLWYYIDPFFRDASIREDSDLDKILQIVDDKTAEYSYDSNAGVTKVNLFSNDATGKKTGTAEQIAFENLKSIWEAGGLLHPRSAGNRSIFTVLDNTTSPRTQVPFHIDNASNLRTNLNASSDVEAEGIIQYVRGVDNVNLRPRTVAYPTSASPDNVWKLGDIINSTPRIVTRIPLNPYDKVYGDTTYKAYIDNTNYKSRGMVFAGGNDGMLHAFRLGTLQFSWGQSDTKQKAKLTVGAGSLGSEAWGFIPKNALPYLKYLQDNNYCHLYYVDLPPQIFDASIGPPESPADNGAVRDIYSWRSILIGGMRFGGACRDNTDTCSISTECVKSPVTNNNGLSSYFAIDVTNPEDPKVLWEFSNQELGFATTGPAIVRINARGGSGAADRSRNGSWYVVLGSGPTGPISDRQFMGNSVQELKLFVIDLKTGSPLRTIPTGITNAFAGSMINSTADLNLDYEDDVLYFGYVNKDTSAGTWTKGGVGRLITKGSALPADWVFSKVIDNIGPVTSSVVRLQNNTYNKNWLFFGSGRYYFEKPDPFNVSLSQGDDPSSQRYLYGLWDKCFMTNNMIDPVCNTRTYATLSGDSSLQNTDTTTVTEAAANTGGIDGWKIPLDTTVSVDYDGLGALKYRTERMITDPLATTAGAVFFTTYRPYGDDCSIGGRTFLWAVRYNTGGLPKYALQGKALLQVSTASVEQLDLSTAFSGDSSLHRGGRRSFSLEGVPPTAQGLSIVSPPPPVKRILHMKER